MCLRVDGCNPYACSISCTEIAAPTRARTRAARVKSLGRVRQLHASLVPIHTDANGTPLDVGRKTRSIPPAIRRALWSRDRGCKFPGCSNKRFVHGHHIEHWVHGGETSVENLVLLCSFHHRLVHEEGFQLKRDANANVVFRKLNGKELCKIPHPTPITDYATDELKRKNTEASIIDADIEDVRWHGSRREGISNAVACLMP